MAAPTITLNKGQILVSKANITPQGILPKGDDYILGIVEAVCSTCGIASIGQYVMFKPIVAFGVLSGGTYYIINESDQPFLETPPL
jgi:hypothetical protein